jgi:hypothetical protein
MQPTTAGYSLGPPQRPKDKATSGMHFSQEFCPEKLEKIKVQEILEILEITLRGVKKKDQRECNYGLHICFCFHKILEFSIFLSCLYTLNCQIKDKAD